MALTITILSISRPPLNYAAVINYLQFVFVVKDLTSISNNVSCIFKVERWCRELHLRLKKFYKEDFARLKNQCHCDPTNDIHR